MLQFQICPICFPKRKNMKGTQGKLSALDSQALGQIGALVYTRTHQLSSVEWKVMQQPIKQENRSEHPGEGTSYLREESSNQNTGKFVESRQHYDPWQGYMTHPKACLH